MPRIEISSAIHLRYQSPHEMVEHLEPVLSAGTLRVPEPGSLASGFRAQLPPGAANYGYSVELTRRRIQASRD